MGMGVKLIRTSAEGEACEHVRPAGEIWFKGLGFRVQGLLLQHRSVLLFACTV